MANKAECGVYTCNDNIQEAEKRRFTTLEGAGIYDETQPKKKKEGKKKRKTGERKKGWKEDRQAGRPTIT